VADAQVASGNPTTNYGAGTNLYVQSSASGFGNERGWLKFDLSSIPAGSSISSASLQLWNWKATGAAMPAELRGGSVDSWTETGITWNTQPVFGAALVTQTLDSASTGLWYNWDISSFVQSKWSGNKLVSLVVKPVTENSSASPAPSYGFDAKEYGSNAPVLQIQTQAAAATVTQVDFYYRFSSDNSTWGGWTLYSSSMAAPFTATFAYPNGQGYYEFYSRATDSNNNVEPAPAAAQSTTHYTAAPPYTTEAIVTLGALSATYDTTAKAVTVTTVPPSLASSTTYNGSTSVPVNAGTYAVLTTVTQAGYTGSAGGTLIIGKSTATVTLGDLNFTNDGTPKATTAATNPAGLSVIITYNGSTTVPVDAGTYSVVVTINDPNYQGSASGTMTIAAASGGEVPVPAFGLFGFMIAAAGLGGMLMRRRMA
jgi:hypothetical protein